MSRIEQDGSASRLFFVSSVFWLWVATMVGAIVATKFIFPDWLARHGWLSFGRLRPVHTNGVLFGWLSMAYVGAIFHCVPQLLGTRLWSERLGIWTAWIWNALIVLAVVTLAAGFTQGVEYAELIWPLDILVAVLFVLVDVNVWMTFRQRPDPEAPLYVSLWYIFASLLWTPLIYVIGNGMLFPITYTGGLASTATPYTGVNHAAVNWFYGHNVIGLWFTTVGLGMVYYLLPAITRNPIYSHKLGLIGFWTLAFTYVWTGQHHLLYGPGPDWLETVAIVFSVSLLIPVWTVLTNFWKTFEGKWSLFFESLPAKWLIFGGWWYFLTCLQGPLSNSLRPISKYVHFTNWVVGHAHLALLGAFTYVSLAYLYYAWPRLAGRPLSLRLGRWVFWLVTGGLIVMMTALWVGGLIQGILWNLKIVELDFATDQFNAVGIPFLRSVQAMQPYYLLRFVSGFAIVAGVWLLFFDVLRSLRPRRETV